MTEKRTISRRTFTRVMGLAAAGTALPACGGPRYGPDGMPPDGPYGSTLLETMMVPMRDGYMPVIRLERAEAQTGLVAKAFVKRTPWAARRSRFGVGTVASP